MRLFCLIFVFVFVFFLFNGDSCIKFCILCSKLIFLVFFILILMLGIFVVDNFFFEFSDEIFWFLMLIGLVVLVKLFNEFLILLEEGVLILECIFFGCLFCGIYDIFFFCVFCFVNIFVFEELERLLNDNLFIFWCFFLILWGYLLCFWICIIGFK